MSDAVDLSAMIGTWVGAGIGIIALVGVLGPLLVILASRTERHKTLNAMGRDTNGYISPGWHFGPNIYLGQRMKAPDLRTGPNEGFSGDLKCDAALLKTFSTEARWVHFGALLEAYGMNFTKRGDVLIQGGKTYLPVHSSWILAVGILGRYSTRRFWQEEPSSRRFTHEIRYLRPSESRNDAPRPRTPEVRENRRATGLTASLSGQQIAPVNLLHGATGSFEKYGQEQRANSPFPTLTYRPPLTPTYADDLETDTLPIKDIFLLFIGLVKIKDGEYLSLVDSQPAEASDVDALDSKFGMLRQRDRSLVSPLRYSRRTRGRSPSSIRSISPGRYAPRPRVHRQEIFSAFRLGLLDIAGSLVRIGSAFADLSIGHDWVGFTPEVDQAVIQEIQNLEGNTYVPADSSWVRLVESPGTYVSRVDAQRMALALLNMPWNSRGYLIGGDHSGVVMSTIRAVSDHLSPMMIRLQEKISLLDLTELDKQRLSTAMDPVLRRVYNNHDLSHDIQAFQKLHELNTILLDMGSPESHVVADKVVAILSITNTEFRDIVHQSIRNLKESETDTIDLDRRSMTLKVPSAFGVRQHFQVDWDAINETTSGTRAHETVPVKHTAIVLACMRSLVFCTMLLTCPDAGPLLELVGECKDVVYMD